MMRKHFFPRQPKAPRDGGPVKGQAKLVVKDNVVECALPWSELSAVKARQARRHVWSEKPMALEVSDAKELMDLAMKNGVRLWAAPTCVTSPQFKFMAEMRASGKMGQVTAGHGSYGHNGPGWSGWFYEKGGGSLYDLGVYNVTTFTGLLGPVKEVVGMTTILNATRKVEDKGEVKVEADENTMLIMNHGNGVLSHVQTAFVYFDGEHAPSKQRKLYTTRRCLRFPAVWEPQVLSGPIYEYTDLHRKIKTSWKWWKSTTATFYFTTCGKQNRRNHL